MVFLIILINITHNYTRPNKEKITTYIILKIVEIARVIPKIIILNGDTAMH